MTRRPLPSTLPTLAVAGRLLAVAACTKPAPEPTPAPPTPPQPKVSVVAAPTTPHWDYGPEHGPALWASLSPDFAACAAGKSQSPIDIVKAQTTAVAPAQTSYGLAELRVVHHEHVADGINNGHTIQVNYAGADTLTLGDEAFDLLQYHFHSPKKPVLRVKNTTPEDVEFIFEINGADVKKSTRLNDNSIMQFLYRVNGVKMVNLVSQTDDMSR